VRPARAAGTVGEGTPDTCTYAALAAAMKGGGLVDFDCGPNPHTITLEGTLSPTPGASTTIDGEGLITFNGANVLNQRLFSVGATANLTLSRLALINATINNGPGAGIHNLGQLTLDQVSLRDIGVQGAVYGAGAIYNGNRLSVANSLFQGNYSVGGGAIYNDAGATGDITDTTFISNTVNGGYGGAITNLGTLTITGGGFTGNIHTLASDCGAALGFVCGGGAIMNYPDATLTISGTVFTSNMADHEGGAILNKGDATVNNSVFSGNTAGDSGGALHNDATASLWLAGAVLHGNEGNDYGGGGIYNRGGDLWVTDTTFDGNSGALVGGGLVNYAGHSTLTGVTFSGNSAQGGGGVYSYVGTITLTHVTLSGNHASGFSTYTGGGLLNDEQNRAWLQHVTFANNTAPAAGAALQYKAFGASELHLTNVLFAADLGQAVPPANCEGYAPDTAVFNLSTDTSCTPAGSGNRRGVAADLGALANNGGPTLTHLPATGSEAVDHGQCIGGLTFDQRGLPRFVGAACDIGAVERQAADFGWYTLLPLLTR
jgi:predicted outer membrane repeat protein